MLSYDWRPGDSYQDGDLKEIRRRAVEGYDPPPVPTSYTWEARGRKWVVVDDLGQTRHGAFDSPEEALDKARRLNTAVAGRQPVEIVIDDPEGQKAIVREVRKLYPLRAEGLKGDEPIDLDRMNADLNGGPPNASPKPKPRR